MSQSLFVKCPDCRFISSTQSHLGIHRSKMHKNLVSDNIKSVNIVRLFPEGKSHYCCLCNNTIASFPNFKRHFSTSRKGVSLNISAKCLICNRDFPKSSGTGVHVKHAHNIGKDEPYPLSPLPVMSFVDYTLSQNNPTIALSTRSHRSRRVLFVHSPLYGITNSPSQYASSTTYDDTSHNMLTHHFPDLSSRYPLVRVLLLVHHHFHDPFLSCGDTPLPVLSDLDLHEDSDPPPSPPDCNSVSELLVAFASFTD